MSREKVWTYRAVCFGQPIGPWRTRLRFAQDDLAAEGLGSRDDGGRFYITVPGGLQQSSYWRDFGQLA